MKKRITAFLLGLGILLLCLLMDTRTWDPLRNQGKLTRYTATFLDVFDTRTELVGYAKTEEEFTAIAEKIKEKLMHYHRLYDIYQSYEGINNLRTINEQAGIAPVEVDTEMIDLLKFAVEMQEMTSGKVNIAMGSVLAIWHRYREHGVEDPEDARLPSLGELEEAAGHTDPKALIIDEAAGTAYLADGKMSLDVGGIGKGYAVQRTAEYIKELGMENFLLSVGGNVYAAGTKADGSHWTVGITNPDKDSREPYVETVKAEDICVVTSGDYQRYYTVDGKNYCHIIDPNTNFPAEYVSSVSIITKDSGVADALSTAVFNMPAKEGKAFIETLEDVEAMWVLKDGTLQYSSGFSVYAQ